MPAAAAILYIYTAASASATRALASWSRSWWIREAGVSAGKVEVLHASCWGYFIHAGCKRHITPQGAGVATGPVKFVAVVIWLGYAIWWEHPGGELGCFFLPPWPWWAPGGTSHQVGWSGEARCGSRGGAPGGAALTFAPGRAAGAVFFQGGSLRDKWLDRAGVARRSWARKN
jgi:hypothetical protein